MKKMAMSFELRSQKGESAPGVGKWNKGSSLEKAETQNVKGKQAQDFVLNPIMIDRKENLDIVVYAFNPQLDYQRGRPCLDIASLGQNDIHSKSWW